MAKNSENRRAWVKNAAIIFLTILLLLTFFSNTILNISLPEVSARYASYGTLSTAVRVDATVKANASYNVIYEATKAEAESGNVQSRKVISVYVREGDYVEKDSVIMELQGGASEQLKALQSEYDALKREYDLALLSDNVANLTSDKTISDAQKAIADAKEDLAKLEAEYSALLVGEDTTTLVESRIEALEEEIETLNEKKSEAQASVLEYQSLISSAEGMIKEDMFPSLTLREKLAIAEEEFWTLEREYEMLSDAVDYCKEELKTLTDEVEIWAEANDLVNQISSLKEQKSELEKLMNRAKVDYEAEIKTLGAAIDAANGPDDKEKKEALEAQKKELETSYERAKEDNNAKKKKLETQIKELNERLEIITGIEVNDGNENSEYDDYSDNEYYEKQRDLKKAQENYNAATEALNEISDDYTAQKAEIESLRTQCMAEDSIEEYEAILATYENDVDYLDEQLKELNKELADAQKELAGISTPKDPASLLAQIETMKDDIAGMEAQFKITKATQQQTDTATSLTRADQQKRLQELQAQIEAYQNAPVTTTITAPIAGRVVSVNCMAGDTVTSGNTVASLEIADQGYVCEVSLSTEEARKIQVGAPCTVVNNWWYNEIEAAVTQIRPDPASQGKNRIVVIEVTGDVSEGQSIKFSIGDKSQSYETVLPNSAIREDNDGKFVLVVEAKDSPLGTRYTARRVDIEIVASDDTQSAVSGLYGSEFVITNSEKPITADQRVRLAENN